MTFQMVFGGVVIWVLLLAVIVAIGFGISCLFKDRQRAKIEAERRKDAVMPFGEPEKGGLK